MTAERVAAAERQLPPAPDGGSTHLRVRFVQAVIMTPHGAINDGEGSE